MAGAAMIFILKTNWRKWRWDGLGLGVAGLCLAHCVVTSTLLALSVAAGGVLMNPAIHEIGLMFAIAFGILALGRGFLRHRFLMPALIGILGISMMGIALTLPHGGVEIIVTVLGVCVLSLGHALNHRASH
jgi:MerC mercury resistance protein